MEIKVLGTGCATCQKLYKLVDTAVAELGADASVAHVTDMADIVAAGIMQTPGLVINGKVKSTGRLPKPKEIKKMIEEEM